MVGKDRVPLQRPKRGHAVPGSSSSLPQPSLHPISSPPVPRIQTNPPRVPRYSDNTRHHWPRGPRGSLFRRTFGWIFRKLCFGCNSPSAQKSPDLIRPDSQDPFVPGGGSRFRGAAIAHVGSRGTRTTRDSSIDALSEGEGINVPPKVTPLDSSDGNRKKVIIGAIRLILRNAVSTLKFSPIPNLDAIPNLLMTWLEAYETIHGNDEDLKGLDDEIQGVYTTILRPLQLWTDPPPPEVVYLIEEFRSALEEQINHIESLKGQGFGTKIILTAEISKRISDVKACINKAVNFFSTKATTLTLLHTIEAAAQSKLERLVLVAAEHTYVKSKSECLPTTRVDVQKSILDHLKEAKNRFVWLRGSPGTGKTAICRSIASTFQREGTLAASFFWDKNQRGVGLDSLERFPSTLARQLALFNGDFKVSLVKRLRQPDLELVLSLPLKKQMRTLVIEPMNAIGGMLSGSNKRFAIVLDGLDECGDPEALESLMELVLLLRKLPSAFAVLVSCRPESTVLSAWTRSQDEIPCEDVDKIKLGDTYHTIRCMVEEGLRDCIRDSPWKPSNSDLNNFVTSCRELPIVASTRIRDVQVQTRHGSTLESELEYFRNLRETPKGLNWEYLRIMRRAYMPDSSSIRPHVAKHYREVVGIIVAARWRDLGTNDISHLLGIAEHEVRSILRPITSIVDLPPDNEQTVKFYHATVKEFITGVPIGDEQDEIFFIHDVNGYSIGLQLLRFVKDVIQKNEYDIPIEFPLGDRKKWRLSSGKQQPRYVHNALLHLFEHLDASLLFSQEYNELQREFEQFLAENLFSFISTGPGHMAIFTELGGDQFNAFNHKSMELIEEARNLARWLDPSHPWHYYRSGLPFTSSSSSLFRLYGCLSDPIRVFSISGKFSRNLIPLSEDGHKAREAMEAKLSELPKKFDAHGQEETNYEAEFAERDVRNGIVACVALSQDGSCVALGFGGGIIEIADIGCQRTISRFQCNPEKPPVWIEFIHNGNLQIATEDTDGTITVLGPGTGMARLGTFPDGCCPAITAVSNNGSLIARVPRCLDENWYRGMALLHLSGKSSVQFLASPPAAQFPQPCSELSIPLRHTIGFSPGDRYLGAYNMNYAFVWSTGSCEFIAQYRVEEFKTWILNTGVEPPCSYRNPEPILSNPTVPFIPGEGAIHARSSELDVQHDDDESWLKHPFYSLLADEGDDHSYTKVYSSAMGRVPLTSAEFTFLNDGLTWVWFNGELELIVPLQYRPIKRDAHAFSKKEAWYGELVLTSGDYRKDGMYYLPRASKDGTRFLLQGGLKAPVVVDISRVV